MWDRFLIELKDGNVCYTTNFSFLCSGLVIDILKQERTFDNGKTWQEIINFE